MQVLGELAWMKKLVGICIKKETLIVPEEEEINILELEEEEATDESER